MVHVSQRPTNDSPDAAAADGTGSLSHLAPVIPCGCLRLCPSKTTTHPDWLPSGWWLQFRRLMMPARPLSLLGVLAVVVGGGLPRAALGDSSCAKILQNTGLGGSNLPGSCE